MSSRLAVKVLNWLCIETSLNVAASALRLWQIFVPPTAGILIFFFSEMSVQQSKSDAITLRFPVIISQSVFLSCDSFLAWVFFSLIIYFDIHSANILQMTIQFVYFHFDFNSVTVIIMYCKNTQC